MTDTLQKAILPSVSDLAKSAGFECIGKLSATLLEANPDVRAMCAADRCRSFEKNWACPPACGTLEDYAKAFPTFTECIVMQTVFTLEDEFDIEGMQEAESLHKKRFDSFVRTAKLSLDEAALPSLALAAGACTRCPQCTYPREPCRFPHEAHASMEAAGLLVSATCEAAGIPYYHGKGTIAYTSCLLL